MENTGTGSLLGVGLNRVARSSENGRVEISRKDSDKSIAFYKAQYYLYKILHSVYPKNIPDCHLAVDNKLILTKIEGDPVFTEANGIRLKFEERKTSEAGIGYYSIDEKTWIENEQERIKNDPKFIEFYEKLSGLIDTSSADLSENELSLPYNVAKINGEYVLAEVLDPTTKKGEPILKTSAIDKNEQINVDRFIERYLHNVVDANTAPK